LADVEFSRKRKSDQETVYTYFQQRIANKEVEVRR